MMLCDFELICQAWPRDKQMWHCSATREFMAKFA